VDCVPRKYLTYFDMAMPILKLRNVLIILTIMEIFASIWGFSYFFIRRSFVYIAVNGVALVLSIIGVFSTIYVNEIGLIFYAMLTTALPGTFFFYQVFEYFALPEHKLGGGNTKLNDNVLLALFSLPYVYDFICGIASIVLMSRIATFNEFLIRLKGIDQEANQTFIKDEVAKMREKYPQEQLSRAYENRYGNNNMTCIICMDQPRTIICRPCNDALMCDDCSKKLSAQFFFFGAVKCPKCRRNISHFEKFHT